jgi:hypothetical protein
LARHPLVPACAVPSLLLTDPAYSRFPGIKIDWLCDLAEDKLTRALKQVQAFPTGRPLGSHDFRRLLEDYRLEAISLAVPVPLQAAFARMAWRAGKSVFVDSPLTCSRQEALDAAGDIQGVRTVVHHRLADHLAEDVFVLDNATVRSSLGALRSVRIHTRALRNSGPSMDELTSMLAGLDFTLRRLDIDNSTLLPYLVAQPVRTKNWSSWTTPIGLPATKGVPAISVEFSHLHLKGGANSTVEFIGENGRSCIKAFSRPSTQNDPRGFVEFLSALRDPQKYPNAAMQRGYLASALIHTHLTTPITIA